MRRHYITVSASGCDQPGVFAVMLDGFSFDLARNEEEIS